MSRAQDGIASRLRSMAFRSTLLQRNVEWFQTNDNDDDDNDDETSSSSPSAIGNILQQDVNKVAESVTVTTANLIRSTCSCVFGAYHMIHINATLFGIAVSVVPLIGGAAMMLRKVIKRVTEKQRSAAVAAAVFAQERLSHVGMVRMSNRELYEVEQYAKLQEEYVRLGREASVANGMFMGFIFAASSGALCMVFDAGGKAVASGRMSSGELTSFTTYTFMLGLGTSGIMRALGERTQGLVSAKRVFGLIDNDSKGEHENKDKEEEVEKKEEKEEEEGTSTTKSTQVLVKEIETGGIESIEMKHVSFVYRSMPGRPVLKDVSLSLKRGQVVALVGKNGSGKSTIASLLASLHKPKTGSVTANGMDYYGLDRQLQKRLVQVVPQQPALFDTSIRENVTYSNPDATAQDVEQALSAANCDEFISQLGGLDYRVGIEGSKLSGGQRQRLGLARALLSDPFLLVLDEPTSALDAQGETAVSNVVQACKDKALLLITHRMQTLQLADLVVVLEDGVIVEQGTFEDLSNKKKDDDEEEESALSKLMSSHLK